MLTAGPEGHFKDWLSFLWRSLNSISVLVWICSSPAAPLLLTSTCKLALCAFSMETDRINLDCQWGWQIFNIRLLLPCSQNKRNHFAPNRKKSILHIWKPHMQNSAENSMLTSTLMNVSAPVGSLLSSNYRRCLCLKETCQIVSVMCMCVDCLIQF